MSIDFRRRSAGEYIGILKARKWLIFLPCFVVSMAVAQIVIGLPNLYESTTLLTISPPKISEKVAPSLTDDDLSQRLQSIKQTVTSRTSLEPMIAKYNLLDSERQAGMATDAMLEKMKSRINFELEKADDKKVLGFRISYRDSTPEKTQQVTSELAGKFVTAQSAESTQSAENTRAFIENQLAQAKANLGGLEKQRLEIMTQNVETLPESGQGLIAQLSGLRQREQTISKDKESLLTELGRVSDSIQTLNSQIRLMENFGEKEAQELVSQASLIEDTPAYGQLIQKRAELSARLENLKKQYRDRHPEIIQTQTDISKINDELDELARNNEKRVKQVQQTSSRKADLQKQSMKIEKEKAEHQIEQIGQQMLEKDQELRRNSEQIAGVEAKINSIPGVKIALEGLTNQYESAKTAYDDLMKKFNNAQQQVQVESDSQGETIRVVDPANLPQTSVNASKKRIFLAGGAGFGLFLGILLAAAFEAPKYFTIKNMEDAEYYTGIPVWASVPPLLTEAEISRQRRNRYLKLLGGLAGSVVSIPLLIAALQLIRIF